MAKCQNIVAHREENVIKHESLESTRETIKDKGKSKNEPSL